jgi:hypothetical protein
LTTLRAVRAVPEGEVRRFSRRLVVSEEPRVVAELAELAQKRGHSVAAEARAALRHWMRSNQHEDDA